MTETDRDFDIVPASEINDREELFELIQIGNGIDPDESRSCYIGNSHYCWDSSQIARMDGRLAGHVGVWVYEMRVGAARLNVGGIGAVCTHPDFRKRGLGAKLMGAVIESMKQTGCDLSRLSGIPDYYHRFGYVRAWSETVYVVQTADLPMQSGPTLKKMPVCQSPELAELYNRQYETVTGTAVRPTFVARSNVMKHWDRHCWLNDGDRIDGYVIVKRDKESNVLQCCEYVGSAGNALSAVKALATQSDCKCVEFHGIPYLSVLARILRRGNCLARTEHNRSGGSMIRTIDLRSALSKLIGELEKQLNAARLSTWSGVLSISNNDDLVNLSISDGRISVSTGEQSRHSVQGGHGIARLLIGSDSPDEIAADEDMSFSGDAEMLVQALFPNRYPTLSFPDRF